MSSNYEISLVSQFFESFSILDATGKEQTIKEGTVVGLEELEKLSKWDRLKLPFRAISARYDINWDKPLGHGHYADVLQVKHLFMILTDKGH